ncbi:MAG: divergent polysaccharide deacetylase family protein, partial [Deltaproteobacteria bacterium]|nr:divergent polysaccharide deacetylase family protein [Deltaproteobacteria bacterium]
KRESSKFNIFWTPAFAGVTWFVTFYGTIRIRSNEKPIAGTYRSVEYLRRFFLGLVVIFAIIALAAIFYINQYEQTPRLEKRAASLSKGKIQPSRKAPSRSEPNKDAERITPTEGSQKPIPPSTLDGIKIAIIIDDVGYDLRPVHDLIELDAPISVAILPHCAHSVEAAEKLHRAGREILLHLPMEPLSYPQKDPGKGGLFVSMSDSEIRRRFEENIRAVPHASGINNHMGSRFMKDEAKLRVVLTEARKKGLFFIDSRTTHDSQARLIALKMGLPFKSRDVFIDNRRSYRDTMRQLTHVPRGTKESNGLLMIGHPYPETLAALRDAIPLLKDRGAQIVPASVLLKTVTEGHRPDFHNTDPVQIPGEDHLSSRK